MEKTSQELVALAEGVRSAVPASYHPAPYVAEAEQVAVPLSHYLWILRRHWWKIILFVAASVSGTYIVTSRITPVYEAAATVDIDRQSPVGVVGQESARSSAINDSDQFLATQVRLVQSDAVLRPVAHTFNLLEREQQLDEPNVIQSVRSQEAPVVLKKLRVTRPPNTYLLMISYRSPDPKLAADVANGIAKSYIEHVYDIRIRSALGLTSFMGKQIEELRAKMEQSSAALMQFERELNIISPEAKTNILSARLMQLNTEYTNAQADRMRKEAARQSVKEGSLEAAQASQLGEPLRKLTEHLNEVQEKFSEIRTHYGQVHPEYKKVAAQLAELQRLHDATRQQVAQRAEIQYKEAVNREAIIEQSVKEGKAEFDRLNARSFEYQARKREAEADKTLYEELVRKIKEAGINASFQNSSIRIADVARPPLKPMFPNLKLNLVLALLFSVLLAVGAAVISDTLDNTIREPEQLARTLKTQVLGSLPMVKKWNRSLGPAASKESVALMLAANQANEHSLSGYDEAVRSLRNSILLGDFDRRIRSLLLTSASPGEGKSTVAAHLAIAHASQGLRTLLIDGDLRRPTLHKHFGISMSVGLSNVALAEIPWQQALIKVPHLAELDILPAGPPSRRATDLLGRVLVDLLDEAAPIYDLIILDAPPLLGFAEPLQMATVVDGVIVVTRAGETKRKALAAVVNVLTRLRANVAGVVLNQVNHRMSESYAYYHDYGKYYYSNGKAYVTPTVPAYLTLRANFVWAAAGNVVGAMAQWGIIVLLARMGNAAMVGQYALGLAIASPIFLLAGLNLRTVQATDVHEEFGFNEYFTLRLLGISVAMVAIAAILGASGFKRETTLVVLGVSLTKAFESVSDVCYGFEHQHERMNRIAKSMIARGVGYLVLLTVVLLGGMGMVLGAFTVAAVAAVVALGYDLRSIRLLSPSQWQTANLFRIAKLAAPLGVIAMLVTLNSNLPRYFLAQGRSERELGLFAALGYVAVAPNLIVMALGQSAGPQLSRYSTFGDRRGLMRLASKLILLAASLGIGCAVAVHVGGGRILESLYGPEYAAESGLFEMLTWVAALGLLASSMGFVLSSTRCFGAQIPMFLAVSVATTWGCWSLIPAHGLLGAAQAQLLGVSLQVLLSLPLLASVIRVCAIRQEGVAA